MTLTQLECFLAVARERHFRRAADRLERTQPAISVQIQRLEGELGLRLFERNGVRVSLTGAGELFLPNAERILSESKLALVKMEEVRGGVSGRIRIAVVPTVAAHFLPQVLSKFGSHFPNVELTIHEEKLSQDVITELVQGDIDLAFTVVATHLSGLKSWTLLKEEFCVGVAQTHALASCAEIAPARLKDEKFVTYLNPRHQSREILFSVCRRAGFDPKIAFESEEAETIQNFVSANLGIAILPEMVLRHARRRGISAIPLEGGDVPSRTIMIHRKVGTYASKALTHFISTAREFGQAWQEY
jgi:LysR family hydrogen peroxide-inducible transcriptional activator